MRRTRTYVSVHPSGGTRCIVLVCCSCRLKGALFCVCFQAAEHYGVLLLLVNCDSLPQAFDNVKIKGTSNLRHELDLKYATLYFMV